MCLQYISAAIQGQIRALGQTEHKAEDIYATACGSVGLLSTIDSPKIIVTQAIVQLQTIEETLTALKNEMQHLASTLPEYETVMPLYGIDAVLGPQLIAEIGDVTRFKSKNPWSHIRVSIRRQINQDKFTTHQKLLPNAALRHCEKICFRWYP